MPTWVIILIVVIPLIELPIILYLYKRSQEKKRRDSGE